MSFKFKIGDRVSINNGPNHFTRSGTITNSYESYVGENLYAVNMDGSHHEEMLFEYLLIHSDP